MKRYISSATSWYSRDKLVPKIAKIFHIPNDAASIIYEWYQAEDSFDEFDDPQSMLTFMKNDIDSILDSSDRDRDYMIVKDALENPLFDDTEAAKLRATTPVDQLSAKDAQLEAKTSKDPDRLRELANRKSKSIRRYLARNDYLPEDAKVKLLIESPDCTVGMDASNLSASSYKQIIDNCTDMDTIHYIAGLDNIPHSVLQYLIDAAKANRLTLYDTFDPDTPEDNVRVARYIAYRNDLSRKMISQLLSFHDPKTDWHLVSSHRLNSPLKNISDDMYIQVAKRYKDAEAFSSEGYARDEALWQLGYDVYDKHNSAESINNIVENL